MTPPVQSGLMLRVHDFVPVSYTNGPGARAVLWVQGCTLACPGCFNPLSHREESGNLVSVQEVFASIAGAAMSIEGLTISGGEPFQQPEPLAELLEQVRRKTNLSVVLFSGYTWEELSLLQHATRILTNIDVLIAGRYIESRRVASGLIGSANKKIHFLTNRYTLSDFDVIPCAEIIITPDGNVLLTGIDPPGGAGVSPAPKKDRHPH